MDRKPLDDEAQWHALVDGRLQPAARAALQARLAADPTAAETLAAWQAQREALRALHAQVLDEPAPANLVQAARELTTRHGRVARWQRWGGLAAMLLLAFGIGWTAHAGWADLHAAPALANAREFGRQAGVAHAVYVPEVRHPVEVDAAQQEHLVQWLSRRLGRPLKIPNLQAQGYELVGGRLLPGEPGARAQFMYQNAGGERVTLYVGALPTQANETSFRFTTGQGVASFYWVDQGFGYALAGKLPRRNLHGLAEAVYRQL